MSLDLDGSGVAAHLGGVVGGLHLQHPVHAHAEGFSQRKAVSAERAALSPHRSLGSQGKASPLALNRARLVSDTDSRVLATRGLHEEALSGGKRGNHDPTPRELVHTVFGKTGSRSTHNHRATLWHRRPTDPSLYSLAPINQIDFCRGALDV